ncbi:MAG TPA: hypothetical protein VFU71_07805 [Burkholderiaceae bacterium]|nr:hypothetical protein [Burkholderiaceae bacterium]
MARVLGLDGAEPASADPGYTSFEHVDGSLLAADEFHLSDSMRLDEVPIVDFSETLPAYSRLARPTPLRSPPIAARLAQIQRH